MSIVQNVGNYEPRTFIMSGRLDMNYANNDTLHDFMRCSPKLITPTEEFGKIIEEFPYHSPTLWWMYQREYLTPYQIGEKYVEMFEWLCDNVSTGDMTRHWRFSTNLDCLSTKFVQVASDRPGTQPGQCAERSLTLANITMFRSSEDLLAFNLAWGIHP